jgi:hypothetical protein
MKTYNIDGYPGYYISKRGILYSRLSGTWRKKKLGLDSKGYYVVKLHNSKKKKHFRINRLVAMVYIPNQDNNPVYVIRITLERIIIIRIFIGELIKRILSKWCWRVGL